MLQGFTVSPVTLNDVEALAELQPEGWRDIRISARYFIASPFCHFIKVTQQQKIVGIGNYLVHKDTAWLAAIIVHQDFRNRGLGLGITQYLVNELRHKVSTIFLDATEFGYPVYKKLGFEVETEYAHYNGQTLQLPMLQADCIYPFNPSDTEQILALDKHILGESREVVLMEEIEKCFVYKAGNEVQGLFFPTLRDGFVIANNDTAGIELSKLRLQTFDFAIMPVDNIVANNFIKAQGFTLARHSKRMRLGQPRNWQPQCLYNRISGMLG